MKSRDKNLDIAKGVLIIFLVFGHAMQFSFGEGYTQSNHYYYNCIFKTIYSFHMPLFMLISGYLFYSSNKKSIMALCFSKVTSIVIPMFSFILLHNLYNHFSCIVTGEIFDFFLIYVNSILGGGYLWFLYSILVNITIITLVTRTIGNKCGQYIVMFLIFALTLFIPDTLIMGAYKFMFPFFSIGYIIKENNLSIYYINKKKYIAILTLLSIIMVWWFDFETYIYTTSFCIANDFTKFLYIDAKRIVIGLVVSYTFMQYIHIFSTVNKNVLSNFLVRLGQQTLFVYCFQSVFFDIYISLLSNYSINFEFHYIIPIVLSVFLIIISYYLYILFKKNNITRVLFLGK